MKDSISVFETGIDTIKLSSQLNGLQAVLLYITIN